MTSADMLDQKKNYQSVDVLIVGGGLIGSSLVCALSSAIRARNLSVLVIEAGAAVQSDKIEPDSDRDARSTALSFGSSQILERLGLWESLKGFSAPIREIVVSDQGRFGATRLTSAEYNLDALGYVVENKNLLSAFYKGMRSHKKLNLLTKTRVIKVVPNSKGMEVQLEKASQDTQKIQAGLVVLAEGGKSYIATELGIKERKVDYHQHAIIANITSERPHCDIAYERFTKSGPIALLPLKSLRKQHRASLVWTVSSTSAANMGNWTESMLIEELQRHIGQRLGQIKSFGKSDVYPLSLKVPQEQIRPSLVLLGNAAHTIHPVAGQGMNLSLRDIEALVFCIDQALDKSLKISDFSILQEYVMRRDHDQNQVINFTHRLIQLFSSSSLLKVLPRKLGLLTLDLFPALRRELVMRASGNR